MERTRSRAQPRNVASSSRARSTSPLCSGAPSTPTRVRGDRAAADGAEAIAIAQELRPDVILRDLRMPNIDGIEATRQIKAILPSTQVVILTAYSDPVLQEEAEGAGAYCYLPKGCSPELVTSVVRGAG
jgi:DNA-binding NarL/FixJ family response regulator